jgi:hypothetical protein
MRRIPNDDAKSFGDRMLQGYAARFVELRQPCRGSCSRRPSALSRARSRGIKSRNGATTVTTFDMSPIEIPELPRQMVMLLDGTRDAEALAVKSSSSHTPGKIGIRENESGQVVTDPVRLEQALRRLVADHLPKLARVGLLLQ